MVATGASLYRLRGAVAFLMAQRNWNTVFSWVAGGALQAAPMTVVLQMWRWKAPTVPLAAMSPRQRLMLNWPLVEAMEGHGLVALPAKAAGRGGGGASGRHDGGRMHGWVRL